MTFRVGQKVVCIDDTSSGKYIPAGFLVPHSTNMHGLKRGSVYTIRSLIVSFGVPCCRLVELTRDYEPLINGEAAYAQIRFRPVVERKADISIFKEMLTPAQELACTSS